jgi:hypothetical protein
VTGAESIVKAIGQERQSHVIAATAALFFKRGDNDSRIVATEAKRVI